MKRRYWFAGTILLIVYAALALGTVAEGELRDYPLEYKVYDGGRFNRVHGTGDFVSERNPDNRIFIEKGLYEDTLETSFNSLKIVRDWRAFDITYSLGYKTIVCDIRMESCEGGDPDSLFIKNETKLLDEHFKEQAPPLGGMDVPRRLGILSFLYMILSLSTLRSLRFDKDVKIKPEPDSLRPIPLKDRFYPVPLLKATTNSYAVHLFIAITSLMIIWYLFL